MGVREDTTFSIPKPGLTQPSTAHCSCRFTWLLSHKPEEHRRDSAPATCFKPKRMSTAEKGCTGGSTASPKPGRCMSCMAQGVQRAWQTRHGYPWHRSAGTCSDPLQKLAIIFSLSLLPQPQKPQLGEIIASARSPQRRSRALLAFQWGKGIRSSCPCSQVHAFRLS